MQTKSVTVLTGATSTTTKLGSGSKFSLQVVKNGATAWTVDIEGSLDGSTWKSILQHTQADSDGTIKYVVDKPLPKTRVNVSVVTGGTSIKVIAFAMD